MANLPSALVVVPFDVPFRVTDAPTTGAPFSPVTVPSTFLVCAQSIVVTHSRSVDSKKAFLILAVLSWLTNTLFPHEIMVDECRKKDLLKRLNR